MQLKIVRSHVTNSAYFMRCLQQKNMFKYTFVFLWRSISRGHKTNHLNVSLQMIFYDKIDSS